MKHRMHKKKDSLVSPMVRVDGEMRIECANPRAADVHGLEAQTAMVAVALENSSAAHAAICDAEFVRRALRSR
jgi:hypothetical protein